MEENELDPLAVEQTEQLVNEFDQQQIESEATAQAKDTEQARKPKLSQSRTIQGTLKDGD